MKRWMWGLLLIVIVSVVVLFVPRKTALTFTQTQMERPVLHYLILKDNNTFQIMYTHSIHLSNVVESYSVESNGGIRLVSMEYEDTSVGMPAYAEEGQTLKWKDGKYTLSYDDKVIPSFELFIGDIDLDLMLIHNGKYNLKKELIRGKSYVVQAKEISLFDQLMNKEITGD